MNYPERIVNKMMTNDAFSQWLGIKIEEISEGFSKISMTVRKEMTNGFGIAHGGISYSFSDSAFAFASNSYGQQAVSIETSISHLAPIHPGDELIAIAKLVSKGNKISVYSVTVCNQDDILVAHFKGTVYQKKNEWDV